ncbi:two component sensor-kinase (plasmid) [Ensifer adhaerens OV14]|nr:two component sensor-kinase [Ensifer adhaerens OV14]
MLAVALAAIIFCVDTFTDIESAIAVLYVVVLLLAAQMATRVGLIGTAIASGFLALLSYLVAHGDEADLQSTLRLIVALAALLVTSVLLVKTDTARRGLLSMNAALKESEARYRLIFDRTRVALWERDYSDLRGYLMDLKARGITDVRKYARACPDVVERCIGLIRIVAANEAAREMLGPEFSAAVPLPHAFVQPARERFLDILQAIIDGRKVFEDRVQVRTDTGETKCVLLSISFPEDPASFNRVVVSMVDVTQRELALKALSEAQAELTKASKAATVGALSASLAHELHQPLGAILVNAQTLLRWLDREPADLSAVRRSAERIIRDSQRAGDIIRTTRGLLSPASTAPESLHAESVIEETLALMEHELQRSGTVVFVELKSPVPPVAAVKIEVQQVLINLLTNAIQAMEGAGCVERSISIHGGQADDDHVCIAVHDCGPGIAEDAKDKLFVPFFTTKTTGLGMGLSICRSTLEARGGKLEGRNHPDGGAVFEMRLLIKPEMEHA